MLQPADILIWRVDPGAPLLGRLIGWGERLLKQTGSDKKNYYHVGFVSANPRQFYESRPPRICLTDVPQPLPDYIEAYRLKRSLSLLELHHIFTYADRQLGKRYNFLGVLTGGFIQIGNLAFCSQFTWEAFTYGSVTLCPWENLESPDDIAASDKLIRIRE